MNELIIHIGKRPADGKTYDEWKADQDARAKAQAEIDAVTLATVADVKALQAELHKLRDDLNSDGMARALTDWEKGRSIV